MLFFSYLMFSSLALSILTSFYWLFLRKETFFKWNRLVLLGIILLAVLLPLLPAPASFTQLKARLLSQWRKEILISTPENLSEIAGLENQIELPVPSQKTAPKDASAPLIELFFYLYWALVLLFTIRLLVQLFVIIRQIRTSLVNHSKFYHIVTLQKDVAPTLLVNSSF